MARKEALGYRLSVFIFYFSFFFHHDQAKYWGSEKKRQDVAKSEKTCQMSIRDPRVSELERSKVTALGAKKGRHNATYAGAFHGLQQQHRLVVVGAVGESELIAKQSESFLGNFAEIRRHHCIIHTVPCIFFLSLS